MPVPLPQLQPKSYTPKPATPFAEPPARTPLSLKRPKGVKPGTVTYPFRKNLPPVKPPPPPTVGSAAGAVAKGAFRLGKAGFVAIAFELLFPPPAGDNYYDRNPKNPPPKYKLQPPEPAKVIEPPSYPFYGGQMPGTLYAVTYELGGSNIPVVRDTQNYYGPISGTDVQQLNGGNTIYSLFTRGFYFYGYKSKTEKSFVTNIYGVNDPFIRIIDIQRVDSQPDTGGNPSPSNNPSSSAPGNSLGAPSAAPPSAAPSPAPTPPPSTAPAPRPNPGPTPQPKRYPGPAPAPSPGPTPQPQPQLQRQPDPPPQPFPFAEPAPKPGLNLGTPPGSSPSPTPAPAPKPGPSPYTSPPPADPTKYPDTGFQPKIFNPNPLTPNPLTPNSGLKPNPLKPSPFTPNPNTGNPEPKAPPLIPAPKTSAPQPTPSDDLFKQIQNLVGPLAIGLAGITALVQPSAIKNAASAATCEAFSPTGCAAPVANNAQAAANNSADNNVLLARILAFLQALQTIFLAPILAGVNLINTKLGPVMAGVNGIGGFLARTAEAAKLDKVLNAMNTILLLHNAAMLSRNLGSTLGDLTSQALATIGIKDGDSPIDVNEILGKQANTFMENLVGKEVWAGTKTSWNKASSIISSATNIMYTVRSMFDSTREIMEWTAENTGKIGNALKRFRVVGENAYKWLPERVTVQNRFTRQIDRIREGTDSLDDAASSLSGVLGEVQSIQQEYADLQEQKQKFDKNISELTPKPRDENKPVSDAVTAAKNVSKAPTEIENVFRGEGVRADA